MAKYRKKPTYVEAFQFSGSLDDIPEWATEAYNNKVLFYIERELFLGVYGKAVLKINIGDYIVKDDDGEILCLTKDFFKKNFEFVQESE